MIAINKQMKISISFRNIAKSLVVLALIAISTTGCFSRNNDRRTTGEEPFFQNEEGLADHGKKTTFDRIYQLDPGDKEFNISDKFYTDPPRKIAILPFDNLIGGKYILNSVPLPRFSTEKTDGWNWTYANRLRRFFFGHFASREFNDIELMSIDKTLQELGVLSPNDLYKIPAQELGRMLDADALIYGRVTEYKNSYYALYKQIRIGLSIKCVSTKDGTVFFEGEQVRHDNDIRVATNPFDFIIASFQNYMSLRDVYAARASEEVVRELVLRIPIVNSFIKEEEQLIRERIKEKLSFLPAMDEKVIDKGNDGDTASPPISDRAETRAQAGHPDPVTLTEDFPVGS
ncbi:hypothetical protein S225a_14140 [Candidatus Brocadiaceae bacterium S225]|uniref:Lipoprotein n=1 Tax=Candidatus Scalindua brodae TaxID=237368 RepID=A0A0B0EEA4_9BACT|nr:MAG: hypothetical protein SCABRO_03245 [Candidatus Scalindua brodae]TWU33525.1 hypothetical protein S225a_14140 [Candidatus Brocadiaceae bacterium S225]